MHVRSGRLAVVRLDDPAEIFLAAHLPNGLWLESGKKARDVFNGSHNALVPLYDKPSIERLGKIAAVAQAMVGAEG